MFQFHWKNSTKPFREAQGVRAGKKKWKVCLGEELHLETFSPLTWLRFSASNEDTVVCLLFVLPLRNTNQQHFISDMKPDFSEPEAVAFDEWLAVVLCMLFLLAVVL